MNTAATSPAAPASGSTSSGKATAAAAAAAAASRPGSATTAPEMELTPGLEQLSEAEIAAAFMGSPVAKLAKGQKAEAKNETNHEAEGEEPEGEDAEGEEAEGEEPEGEDAEGEEAEGEESGGEDTEGEEAEGKLDKGLDKALKDHPGLRKRIKKLMAENPALKRQLKEATRQLEAVKEAPEVVLAADASNPLATASTEAEVDKQAAEMAADIRAKLRWLNKHADGGTWQAGTPQAREMSEADVEAALDYYETLQGSLETAKTERKQWLKTYGATVKEIGADNVTALLKPKVVTRESALVGKVPELMRDPEFLQVLADAKAGREMREKQKAGVKFVEVKAGGNGSRTTGTERPGPKTGAADTLEPLTQTALEKLRADADAGDKQAQAKLDRYFMAQA